MKTPPKLGGQKWTIVKKPKKKKKTFSILRQYFDLKKYNMESWHI